MSYQLGIDLGTTFTSVASADLDSIEVVALGQRQAAPPAVIYVEKDGTFVHGDMAYRKGATAPDRLITDIKRRLGQSAPVLIDGTNYRAEELVGAHLQWAYDRAIERRPEPPSLVVLTHPACWSERQLRAFHQAVESTTVPNVAYLTEPYAAGLFYQRRAAQSVGELIGVYDLGGGTFDAAILQRTDDGFQILGTPAGEAHLGGLDLDRTMRHLVQTKLGRSWTESELAGGPAFERSVLSLDRECNAAKEMLSEVDSVEIPVLLPSGSSEVQVTRDEYERYIDDAVSESVGVFRRVLQSADVGVGDLATVIMVGGSTAIPLVNRRVSEFVGPGVNLFTTDPKHAVSKGAAVFARTVVQGDGVVATTPLAAVAVAVAAAPEAAAPEAAAEPTTHVAAPSPDAAPIAAVEESSESQNPFRLVGVQVLLAVLVLGVGYFLLFAGGDDEDDETATAQNPDEVVVALPGPVSNPSVADLIEETEIVLPLASAEGMVEIPAGSYAVGVDTPGRESLLARTVEVAAFHIDATEVTNVRYLPFVQLEGAPAPSSWQGGNFADGEEEYPVVGVEWSWAHAYCQALGKRLPSEAEWEVAARGAEGGLYPWGTDEVLVDFDARGKEPVRSVPDNVSSFGVYDTVGSVWEWVDEPMELTAEATQVVRRGGENGRVDETIGAAIRQVVQQSNRLTVDQTGLRCAATEVDPETPVGEFINDLVVPSELAASTSNARVEGAFVQDEFENPDSGWFEVTDDGWRVGYHAPTWYHVESTKGNSQIMALGGFSYDNVAVETSVFVESTDTPDGLFRYGLVFRASGAAEPPSAENGNDRPLDFYAFSINPRAGTWELLHEDELPFRVLAEGPLPDGFHGFDSNRPDTIRAEMVGVSITLTINGQSVTELNTRGFHPAGDVGFFLETFDETKAHVHFENMLITPL